MAGVEVPSLQEGGGLTRVSTLHPRMTHLLCQVLLGVTVRCRFIFRCLKLC